MKLFLLQPKYVSILVGSSFEGTATQGMASDTDILMVLDASGPVVTDLSEIQQYAGDCLLLVQDSYTPAGYAKLQNVHEGKPRYFQPVSRHSEYICRDELSIDREGRYLYCIKLNRFNIKEIHGPALTESATKFTPSTDFVNAKRCCRWPECASEWICRQRHYQWPPSNLIDICKRQGCFLVPVGHPNSEEKNWQWRISFSLQERLLISHFNSTQLKCFVLLKMIKKEILPDILGEESITTYHCKTCLLYMIENSPENFWVANNLLACLHNCFKLLLTWTETGVLPNYFIPAENMLDGRIRKQLRVRLSQCLKDLLSADFKYILEIKSDHLGYRIENSFVTKTNSLGAFLNEANTIPMIMCRYLKQIHIHLKRYTVRQYEKETTERVIENILTFKFKLQNTEILKDSTREESKKAITFMLPYVELHLMSSYVMLAKQMHKDDEIIYKTLTSKQWHQISVKSDSFSFKLKQASFLYMLGYYQASLDILLPLKEKLIDNHLTSFCACSFRAHVSYNAELLHVDVSSEEELLNRFLIPCVCFLPSERNLTPSALRYEMIRAAGPTQDDSLSKYGCAVVDGKILLNFLLCLNHSVLGKKPRAAVDAEEILQTVVNDNLLGHRVTALNLLGGIRVESGNMHKAVNCFKVAQRYIDLTGDTL